MKKNRLRRFIAYRLLIAVLIFSSFITVLITAVQLYVSYRGSLHSLAEDLAQIKESNVPSIAVSLWVMDRDHLRLQLEGLRYIPHIIHAKIEHRDRLIVEAGAIHSNRIVRREFPLLYIYDDKEVTIGVLKVTADIGEIYSDLWKKLVEILIFQGSQIFLVSLFILFIFQMLVTRHLAAMAKHFTHFDPQKRDNPLALHGRTQPVENPDELDLVVAAINTMSANLEKSFHELATELDRRRKAEEALRKSEALLNETQRISRVGGWEYEVATQKTLWTDGVYRIYEVPRDYGPGDIGRDMRVYRPEDRGALGRAFQKAVEEGEPYDLELPLTTAGGRRLWVRTTAKVEHRNGKIMRVYGNIMDITEHKLAVDALRESEERMKLAVEGTEEGIWDLDMTSGELYLDDNSCHDLGYEPAEIRFDFNWWSKCLHPDSKPVSRRALADYLEGRKKYYELEYRIRTRTGEWKWIWCRGKAVAYDKQGNPVRMIGTHRDITERKKTEDLIKASLSEKEILLREIHHRVKNNMQVIISLLKLQVANVKDERVADVLKDSQSRIQAMSLVHEALYRSESPAAIDLGYYFHTLARAIYQTYGPNLGHIELKVDASGMELGIEQATPLGLLMNELVTNSLKYAFPDKRDGEILIRARAEDHNDMEFVVSDNGVGMSPDFEWKNTGSLGLQLVVTLAETQLGGTILLEPSQGTTFTVRFKRQEDSGHHREVGGSS